MSEIVNNLDAAKAVPVLLNEIDAIKAQLVELETKKLNQQPISDDQISELERDIAYNVAELDVLKSSVPEGYVDDSNVQYFLAVGEIQKSNETLRQQLQFSERNLDSIKNDVKETKELIQNLKEINKELKLAHEKRKEEKKKEYEAKSQISANDKRTARIEKLQNEERDILTKKRSTIKIFSEIKVFLKDLLPKISPATINEESDSPLAMILQHLWNVFHNEGKLVYTDISSLEFDVNENDIDVLLHHYIIQSNPTNKNEIRMIDFTQ